MLQWSLARFKIAKNEIIPLFTNDVELAKELMSFLKVGEKIGEIKDEIKYLEKIYDYKLVRGLFTLLIRASKLEESSPIEPIILRRALFEKGPVLDEEEREKIIEEVRKKYGVDPIKFMFSDLDEERKIVELPQITAEDLIKWYNLSLLQTLLFKAYKLSIYVSSNWKEIIKRAKWLGLMYFAYEKPLRIDFIGPATLVKMNEKYGRNFAVLLPYIVSSENWKIEAEIVLGKKKKRIYKLTVENYRNLKAINIETDRFDSSVEEKFYTDFTSVVKDWKIIREPEPLVVGNRLFIPDFLVEKGKLKVYIEIVGFWTKEYIREKIEKLKGIKEPILVLLNEELSIGDFSSFNVIKFRRKVNVGEVYRWLKNIEEKEYSTMKIDYTIDSGRNVVSIKEIAEKYSLPSELIRKNLKEIPGYVFIKNYYVREDFLEKLKEIDFSGKKVSELRSQYGDFIVEVLNYLGYKLIWKGVTDAIVVKNGVKK